MHLSEYTILTISTKSSTQLFQNLLFLSVIWILYFKENNRTEDFHTIVNHIDADFKSKYYMKISSFYHKKYLIWYIEQKNDLKV